MEGAGGPYHDDEDVIDLAAEEGPPPPRTSAGWAPPPTTLLLASAAAASGQQPQPEQPWQQGRQPSGELEAETARQAASGVLLPFQRAMVSELLAEDGLCVMSPGLGLHQVAAVLLHLQDARLRQPGQAGCMLVLGASPWQRDAIRRELLRIDPLIRARAEAAGGGGGGAAHAAAACEVPAEVTAEVAAGERQALYGTRPCLFVTTRILVVDLLSGRLAADSIAGLLVLNAHRVTDTSGEGFAARLFRAARPTGVVRALSDSPLAFASDFNKVEKAMKALHVRRLYLWPRFQAQARDDLEARPPQLVELATPLGPALSRVYAALAELMDACVRELRKTNKLDTSDLTVDQGLFRSFDEAVRRQLAPIWHTVSPKTRQIVADLRTLRGLAGYALTFDAVTFVCYLDSLRATEGAKSVWLFHSAAHAIFEAAKGRVYRLRSAGDGGAAQRKRKAAPGEAAGEATPATGAAPGAAPAVEAVLEPLPKWELLIEVMEEIQELRGRLLAGGAAAAAAAAGGGGGDGQGGDVAGEQGPAGRPAGEAPAGEPPAAVRAAVAAPVLVVCRDTFTARQLREVLKPGGPGALMQRLYRDYLQYKLDGGASGRKRAAAAAAAAAGAAEAAAGGAAGPSQAAPQARMMGGYRPGEETALLREARALAGGGGGGGGGRGGRGGRGRGRGRSRGKSEDAAAAAAAALAAASTAGRGHAESPPLPARGEAGGAGEAAGGSQGQGGGEGAVAQHQPLLAGVEIMALEEHDVMRLWDVQPGYVVMYDPDVAFTRLLELYKAGRPGAPLCVYSLRCEDSFESDRYQAAVARERQVFEGLIRGKELMILPIAEGREQVDPARRLPATRRDEDAAALGLGAAANALTRRGGGRAGGRPPPRRVVVDVREFMSSLPAVLHQQGMEVVPLTLEVGDYVLSPDACVERKSLPDLRSSLASGRLYHQAEAMTRHYKTPILLIEFEGDRAFALQAASEVGDEVQLHSLMGRIALLVLHFPRLRLVWSRSLHATADIFRQLKANQEEPDPVAAATAGVPDEAAGGGEDAVVNQAAQDLLRRLPGVSEVTWRPLARAAGSLAGLAALSREQLAAALGGAAAAKRLHEFLHQDCAALFSAL